MIKYYIIVKLIFWLLLAIPLYFWVWRAKDLHEIDILLSKGVPIEGMVYEVKERVETDENYKAVYYYKPIVWYVDENGEQQITELKESLKPYMKSEKIELLYIRDGSSKVVQRDRAVLEEGALSNVYFVVVLVIYILFYVFVRIVGDAIYTQKLNEA